MSYKLCILFCDLRFKDFSTKCYLLKENINYFSVSKSKLHEFNFSFKVNLSHLPRRIVILCKDISDVSLQRRFKYFKLVKTVP